jgi:hypothetical protein
VLTDLTDRAGSVLDTLGDFSSIEGVGSNFGDNAVQQDLSLDLGQFDHVGQLWLWDQDVALYSNDPGHDA